MPFFCFLASFSGARTYLVAYLLLPVCLFLVFRLLFLPPGHTFLLAFLFQYAFFLFSNFFSCRRGILGCLFSTSGMPFSPFTFRMYFQQFLVIKITNIIIFVLFKFYLNPINSISAHFFKNKNLNTIKMQHHFAK